MHATRVCCSYAPMPLLYVHAEAAGGQDARRVPHPCANFAPSALLSSARAPHIRRSRRAVDPFMP